MVRRGREASPGLVVFVFVVRRFFARLFSAFSEFFDEELDVLDFVGERRAPVWKAWQI
jgi:hypothetical protein